MLSNTSNLNKPHLICSTATFIGNCDVTTGNPDVNFIETTSTHTVLHTIKPIMSSIFKILKSITHNGTYYGTRARYFVKST